MEEKQYQIPEEENYTNYYNYEEFVRIIKKDDDTDIKTKSNKIEEIENKENQKYIFNNNCVQSSDLTSVSFSQIENLSQTSDNIYVPYDIRISNLSENQKETKINENELDYFFGVENYFRKISPEKFEEYKNSRNYIPKKNIIKENKMNINISPQKNNNDENKINKAFQTGNNYFYYPINYNYNILFYMYNNFFFNLPKITKIKKLYEKNKNKKNKKKINKKIIKKNKLII